jgi:hypothetical protein
MSGTDTRLKYAEGAIRALWAASGLGHLLQCLFELTAQRLYTARQIACICLLALRAALLIWPVIFIVTAPAAWRY